MYKLDTRCTMSCNITNCKDHRKIALISRGGSCGCQAGPTSLGVQEVQFSSSSESYGCQVWLPETWYVKYMTGQTRPNSLQNIAKDPLEVLHLTFLKWTLGVNGKTSNAAVWGDCGKYPLALELTKQVYCYYERLQKLELEGSDSLVRHAYSEQRHLKLAWYNKLTELRQTIQDRENNHVNYPSKMRKSLRTTFCEFWEAE